MTRHPLGHAERSQGEGGPTTMARDTTMLELVTDLSRDARSDEEVVAAVVSLVSSGAVRLCGTFKGHRFETPTAPASGR
jgi:hypothetical protein